MSKPLLTDDIIEQAKRGEIDLEDHPYYQDYEEEFYDEDYVANYQPSAYKSRRVENAKRNQFQHKLNRILFWIVVLLIILIVAVFYF
ncbi:cell wall synthase accessory phosphoprotein MacP [Streptococcus thermophilus]|uniref:cell wall synthase accessory phosphoprotein MacP n=1 Tax=Streptococcus thermophilus TaxID=1308 RepID=UPI0022FE82FF|nr:cell wall synthase accessory phosphoprotein MacP [Streptococcus thermophilus]MDA5519211.1 cell wall synthase accessory phosphoprotein MacP [Streptococcus thermophilus]MDW2957184.1 cell wall synthase accessory phosphoprotein MacP [Streptococcus thermophilus]